MTNHKAKDASPAAPKEPGKRKWALTVRKFALYWVRTLERTLERILELTLERTLERLLEQKLEQKLERIARKSVPGPEPEPERQPEGQRHSMSRQAAFSEAADNLSRLIFDKEYMRTFIYLSARAGSMEELIKTVLIPMLVVCGTVTPWFITSDTFYNMLAPFVRQDVPGFHKKTSRIRKLTEFRDRWLSYTGNKYNPGLDAYYKKTAGDFVRLSGEVNAKLAAGRECAVG